MHIMGSSQSVNPQYNNDHHGDDKVRVPSSSASINAKNHTTTATKNSTSTENQKVDSPTTGTDRSSLTAFHNAQTILAAYDKDGNQALDAHELDAALKDYQKGKGDTAATRALAHYDANADGDIQGDELHALFTDIDTSETTLKYLAFCGSLSTMGKVVRAIHAADGQEESSKEKQLSQPQTTKSKSPQSSVSATKHIRLFWNRIRGGVVRGSWRVTYAYALLDTCWEGYKQSLDGNYEQGARHMVSRAWFNTAMVLCSMYTVKWTVQGTYAMLPSRNRWASFWGSAAPPMWVLPCALSAEAVLQIPTLIAPSVKQILHEVFKAETGRGMRQNPPPPSSSSDNPT